MGGKLLVLLKNNTRRLFNFKWLFSRVGSYVKVYGNSKEEGFCQTSGPEIIPFNCKHLNKWECYMYLVISVQFKEKEEYLQSKI